MDRITIAFTVGKYREKLAYLGEGPVVRPTVPFDPELDVSYECVVVHTKDDNMFVEPADEIGLSEEVYIPSSVLAKKPLAVEIKFHEKRPRFFLGRGPNGHVALCKPGFKPDVTKTRLYFCQLTENRTRIEAFAFADVQAPRQAVPTVQPVTAPAAKGEAPKSPITLTVHTVVSQTDGSLTIADGPRRSAWEVLGVRNAQSVSPKIIHSCHRAKEKELQEAASKVLDADLQAKTLEVGLADLKEALRLALDANKARGGQTAQHHHEQRHGRPSRRNGTKPNVTCTCSDCGGTEQRHKAPDPKRPWYCSVCYKALQAKANEEKASADQAATAPVTAPAAAVAGSEKAEAPEAIPAEATAETNEETAVETTDEVEEVEATETIETVEETAETAAAAPAAETLPVEQASPEAPAESEHIRKFREKFEKANKPGSSAQPPVEKAAKKAEPLKGLASLAKFKGQ